jgi:hypothetical protein
LDKGKEMSIKGVAAFFLIALFAFTMTMMIWHPHPYNTETVCFDDKGELTFYASGYSPNTDKRPLIHLAKGRYKIRKTSELLEADCKITWGVEPPKGRKYWEIR